MNNIFNKNIEALKTKDLDLAQRISSHVITDIPQLINENNAYNFLYKGYKLHNELSPLGEAKEIFARVQNSPVAIHLIYGIGLGYLFQVASANSAGTVILYEPDLNILKIAFTLVDFSNDILKKNVFITDSVNLVGSYIYQKSNTKNSPYMLMTTAYRNMGGEKLEELIVELQKMVGMFGLDRKYTQQKFYPLLHTVLRNIPQIVNEPPLIVLKDKLKGKTAVVVSAGPTLDRDIEVLKKYREKYILFAVGTAMKTLDKNGIKPDFLCIIESFDCSRQIQGLNLQGVKFITEPTSNPNLRKANYDKRFSHIASNMPINGFWAEIANLDIEEYSSKGTVSYTAINSARILGCSRIILVGQDLAYIEGQCYSKDSAYKDLLCTYNQEKKKWEIVAKDIDAYGKALNNSNDEEALRKAAKIRIDNLNKSLYYVKGINGDMIPTESVYAAFIKPMSEFTELYPEIEYINCSLKGAQINGFKNVALEEALQNLENIEDVNFNCEYEYNIEKIKQELNTYIQELNNARTLVENMQHSLRQFKNNLIRTKVLTEDLLRLFKKQVLNFIEISEKYSATNKMFDLMTISDKIELDYEMKMTTKFEYDSIVKFSEKFSNYYETAQKRIVETSNLITRILGGF